MKINRSSLKFLKFFNDRALGVFSASALFGFLLCLRSEGLPVLNIVMWAVTGLSLLLFFVRLSVLLFGKDAGSIPDEEPEWSQMGRAHYAHGDAREVPAHGERAEAKRVG